MHNVKVVVSYSTIGKEVRDAFIKAGYTIHNWEKAAAKALTDTQWHYSTIAHGFGNSMSGQRGGTSEDVYNCAQHLISWAAKNPKKQKEKKDNSKYGYGGNKKDDEGKKDDDNNNNNNNNNGPSNYSYKAPWHGGPSAWVSRKTN